MSEKAQFFPFEATAELLGQLEGMPLPNRPNGSVATSTPLVEVASQITEYVAPDFLGNLPGLGQQVEYLTAWYSSVKGDCSITFSYLRKESPTLSREDLNATRELQLLNGIRRGVHRAMVKTHKKSSQH